MDLTYPSMKIDDKNIFFLDGAGALLSAFSTGVVLPFFYQWTGIATSISSPLALLGLGLAIYSLSCFWFVKRTKPIMLLGIIFANLFYCLLALIILLTVPEITNWGRAFFFVEILLLAGVVLIESVVYRRSFGYKPQPDIA